MTCPNEASLLEFAENGASAHCDDCSATVRELRDTIASLRRAARAAVMDPPARTPRWIAFAAAAAALAATSFGMLYAPSLREGVPAAPATVQDKADKQDAPPPKEDAIRALVKQLGDESLEKRDAALSELARLGKDAKPFLEEGLKSDDPEVRARSGKLIARIRRAEALANYVHPVTRAAGRGDLGPGAAGSVARGLKWLTANQGRDGNWAGTGTTALALLAYFAAGEGESSKEHGKAIGKGLAWLQGVQDPDGCVGGRGSKYIYGHAVATWALAEAHGGGYSVNDLKKAAERAVTFLVEAQNAGLGWRYSARSGDNDTSVTFWCASALAIAKACGFDVPAAAFDGARAWLDGVRDANDRLGYTAAGTGKVFIMGLNADFQHHETMSGAGIVLRRLAGDVPDAVMANQAEFLRRDPPSTAANDQDFYYWHIGSLAMFQYHGAEGAAWINWRQGAFDAIVGLQAADGSWNNDRWSGDTDAGPVYATAINVLTLTTEFRYPTR